MVEFGYALSSEEHRPNDLVRYARRAEEAGFTFALISDHFHPWIDKQGQSAFVWSVLGAIAHATERLRVGTGVTCPIIRTHPAIIAQAAATVASMMPGRFFLGVGTGENLNEHIIGEGWPAHDIRLAMLTEAIEVMRLLWEGGMKTHRGDYFTVENARIYTLPEQPVPIMVAASGPETLKTAGRVGDGLIALAPSQDIIDKFHKAGGETKPCYGQLTICWAPTEDEATKTAMEWWPTSGIPGQLYTELALPQQFEQVAKLVTPEQLKKKLLCTPDPAQHINKLKEYMKAGFSHVYIHQIGPDQEGFFRFYEREVLPALQQGTQEKAA